MHPPHNCVPRIWLATLTNKGAKPSNTQNINKKNKYKPSPTKKRKHVITLSKVSSVGPHHKIRPDSTSTRLCFTELSQHCRHWKSTECASTIQRFDLTSDLRFVIRNPNPYPSHFSDLIFIPCALKPAFSYMFIFCVVFRVFSCFLWKRLLTLKLNISNKGPHLLINTIFSTAAVYFIFCFLISYIFP